MPPTHLTVDDLIFLLIYSDDVRATVIKLLCEDAEYRAEVEEALVEMPCSRFSHGPH